MYQDVMKNIAAVIEATALEDTRIHATLKLNPLASLVDDEGGVTPALDYRVFSFADDPKLKIDWKHEASGQAPSMADYVVNMSVYYPVGSEIDSFEYVSGVAIDDAILLIRQLALEGPARFHANPVTNFQYSGCQAEHLGCEYGNGTIVSTFNLRIRFVRTY